MVRRMDEKQGSAEACWTREELANAADAAFRKTFRDLAKRVPSPITERTLRFWTDERLLPRRGRPNLPGLYEPELVHRCVFIRRLRAERTLTLEHIRHVLSSVD